MTQTSSTPEKPLCQPPRKLIDWLNPGGQRKVYSLVDKVYQTKNLQAAWEKVKANRRERWDRRAEHRRIRAGLRGTPASAARGAAYQLLSAIAGPTGGHPEGR